MCLSSHVLRPSSPSGFSAHHLPNSPHAMPCPAVGPCTLGLLPACCVHCLHAVCTGCVHGMHAVCTACCARSRGKQPACCALPVRGVCMLCVRPACYALPVREVCMLCAWPRVSGSTAYLRCLCEQLAAWACC